MLVNFHLPLPTSLGRTYNLCVTGVFLHKNSIAEGDATVIETIVTSWDNYDFWCLLKELNGFYPHIFTSA